MENIETAQPGAQNTPTATIVVPEKAAKIYALWQKVDGLTDEFTQLGPTSTDTTTFINFCSVLKGMFVSELESADISRLK